MKTGLEKLVDWLKVFEQGPIQPTRLRITEKAIELLREERTGEAGELERLRNRVKELEARDGVIVVKDETDPGGIIKFPLQEKDPGREADEKETMVQAFGKIQQLFEARSWIMQGRGPYAFNDDGFYQEVTSLYKEFAAIQQDVWRQIRSGHFEYRNSVIEEYKKEKEAWIRIEAENTPWPDYDEMVLWRDYKGNVHWDCLDKDGNPCLHNMTHFRRLELPKD